MEDKVGTISERFGARVLALRHDQQMSQKQMAAKFGLDRSYISDVERGKKSASLFTLSVLAGGFGISMSALFEGL